MQVRIKYFASLRETVGKTEETITVDENLSIGQLWEQLSKGKNVIGIVLMTQNMTYVDSDAILQEGDEVAFFPPVTGG